MHLPERNILTVRPGIDRVLRQLALRRCPVTHELFPPGLEHLIDRDTLAQRFCSGVICGDEYAPGLPLIVGIVARYRNRPAQISDCSGPTRIPHPAEPVLLEAWCGLDDRTAPWKRKDAELLRSPPPSPTASQPSPRAPSFQHVLSTTVSTLRCETFGRIARIPASNAATVAFAAVRKAAISSAS